MHVKRVAGFLLTIFLDIDDDSVMKHSSVIWWKDVEAGVHRGRQYNYPTYEAHNCCDNTSGAEVKTATLFQEQHYWMRSFS